MLKIKKISLSGFRGIVNNQDLSLLNGTNPSSLVVYGLNSSGKTSFVDGLEWFLSPANEIEWLKRENAGCHAYPHQEASGDEIYVEIEFSDNTLGVLRKTYNSQRITKPVLSPSTKFNDLYKLFTIRPYLRYLEIIDFVFNRTGVEKYQKLANWMGFEKELAFQEKIALGIIPKLKEELEKINNQIEWKETEIKTLTNLKEIPEIELIDYCNNLLKTIGQKEIKSLSELSIIIKTLENKRTISDSSKLVAITRVQTNLEALKLDSTLISVLQTLRKKIKEFTSKKELADKIEYINVYEKAFEIINKQDSESVSCPVCGLSWEKDKLIKHVKDELILLQEVKEIHAVLLGEITKFKQIIIKEVAVITRINNHVQTLKDININIEGEDLLSYKTILETITTLLNGSIFDIDENTDTELQGKQTQAIAQITALKNKLESEKNKLKPSESMVLYNETTEKLKVLNEKLDQILKIKNKYSFYDIEIKKFISISDEFFCLVQTDITQKFKNISALIEKYFKILRPDKDIKGIEIVLNLDKSRAAGRSAEIQLSYYDLVVKPAYKVLSESLLNSLGLAVYFTCIKTFNTQSKFIVLDDVMNSLDVGHRDTLLDLIEQEFSDYQIILFTHDLYWFEKIQRRFANWLHKKIKSWSYTTGPAIDPVKTSLQEINDLLQDATKAHDAGRNLGIYIENILNELCEQLQAELRYRYSKNDPPTLEELFIALVKRMKEKLNRNSVVDLIQNAQKYEPLLRNATSHSRTNYSSSISPVEVKRAMEEWSKVEKSLWCSSCNKFVEYKRDRNQIECRCGKLNLQRV